MGRDMGRAGCVPACNSCVVPSGFLFSVSIFRWTSFFLKVHKLEMVVESAQSAPNEELSEMRAAPEFFAVYKSLGGSADEAEYRRRLTSFFLHTMNSALGYDADICGLPLTATHDEKGYRFYASRGEAQRAFREAEQIDGDEFMRIFKSVDMVHPYS
jgi:hypothetical protein